MGATSYQETRRTFWESPLDIHQLKKIYLPKLDF
jgi:hypothetical protein